MAQLSSDLDYFSCFLATADIVIEVDDLDNILPSWSSSTSTSMTMIFSTNQRPRNYLTHPDIESTYCQALLYEQRLQKSNIRIRLIRTPIPFELFGVGYKKPIPMTKYSDSVPYNPYSVNPYSPSLFLVFLSNHSSFVFSCVSSSMNV